jgi:hypothetical protein
MLIGIVPSAVPSLNQSPTGDVDCGRRGSRRFVSAAGVRSWWKPGGPSEGGARRGEVAPPSWRGRRKKTSSSIRDRSIERQLRDDGRALGRPVARPTPRVEKTRRSLAGRSSTSRPSPPGGGLPPGEPSVFERQPPLPVEARRNVVADHLEARWPASGDGGGHRAGAATIAARATARAGAGKTAWASPGHTSKLHAEPSRQASLRRPRVS